MDVSFDYYRVFYHVAKTGNITRAAAALMSSQPNVTRTIRLLENQLGCTLFLRTGRGVRLTREGEVLYAHVRIAMEQLETGMEALSAAQTLQGGSITIGASEVALRCFLLPVLNRFHRSYPHVKLRIFNCSAVDAIENLRSGAVDIAMARVTREAARELEVSPLRDIQEAAVCGDAFAELTAAPISLEQLSRCPIISLGSQTLMHQVYRGWFAQRGLDFSPEIEVATSDQILPIVEHDLGVGILPEQFFRESGGRVHRLELAEPIPSQPLCYLKRKDLPLNAAGTRLEEMILSAAAQGGSENRV